MPLIHFLGKLNFRYLVAVLHVLLCPFPCLSLASSAGNLDRHPVCPPKKILPLLFTTAIAIAATTASATASRASSFTNSEPTECPLQSIHLMIGLICPRRPVHRDVPPSQHEYTPHREALPIGREMSCYPRRLQRRSCQQEYLQRPHPLERLWPSAYVHDPSSSPLKKLP